MILTQLLTFDANLLISARQLVWEKYAHIIQILGESIVIWWMFILIWLWISGVIKKDVTNKKNALRIFFLIISVFLIYSIINIILPQWRPSPQTVAWGIAPLIPHPIDNSFPSWHAIFGGTICMGIWIFMKNRTLLAITMIITIITGVCRVIWWVHYPGDILWGIIIACFGSYFLSSLVVSETCENTYIHFLYGSLKYLNSKKS